MTEREKNKRGEKYTQRRKDSRVNKNVFLNLFISTDGSKNMTRPDFGW